MGWLKGDTAFSEKRKYERRKNNNTFAGCGRSWGMKVKYTQQSTADQEV